MIRAVDRGRPYLTPPEVGRRLGVNADKVLSWIHAGKLRAINVSSGAERPRYRIHAADLEVFLAALAVNVAQPARRRRQSTATEVIEFVK